MALPDLTQELNEEQRAAVLAPDGPILVLAAAGTGKTRTLVYRVAHLAARGVPAERLLLLTFTNRAAHEMLDRAEAVAGGGISGMWGGTFHHLANRILRRYAPRLGYTHDYTILDRDDAKTVVTNCIRELGHRSDDLPKPAVLLGLFSAAVNMQVPLEALAERRLAVAGGEQTVVAPEVVARIGRAYEARKRALNALDFDDLLVRCRQLFEEQADVLAHYQDRFMHVLVDEYQDTNPVQARLVDLLAAQRRNLLVVGDDFQSIYGWRGADFRNIMSFPQRYPEAQVFKLETNYRSVPEILTLANACIAGNPEQFQKTLRSTREPYRKPVLMKVANGDEQAGRVVHHLLSLRREGYRYRDMAVLYRAHFHALELERELTRQRVPYTITSGVRFFEQAHIKDVCCVLRLLVASRDELAFLRLLGLLPKVGARTAEKVWNKLGGRFASGDAAAREQVRAALPAGAREAWAAVAAVLAADSADGLRATPGELVRRFVHGFYEAYALREFDNADTRLEDIEALAGDMARYESLESFLSDVALLTNLDAETGEEDAGAEDVVRLSTVHQAKGLEWPVVVVLWLADGMFPSKRALDENETEGAAEERRLFYVALTRARDELLLCAPEYRTTRDGGGYYCKPSRFVEELPAERLRIVRGGY